MVSNIPLEIIGLIIDIVANNDYHEGPAQDTEYWHKAPIEPKFPNTKACSLTSRAFLHRCRHHIFYYVSIFDRRRRANSWTSWYSSAQLFAQLIADNAEIPHYVRKLQYEIQEDDIGPEGYDTGPEYCVPPALTRLTNLESLTLCGEEFFKWDRIRSPSMSPLLQLIHGPKIVSLWLVFVRHFEVSDLAQCRNLRNLDLEHVLCDSATDNVVSSILPSSTAPLHHLGIKYGDPDILKLELPDGQRILNTDALKSISTRFICPDDMASAPEIYQHIRGLETVNILVTLMEDVAEPVLSVISPSLETLSKLIITVDRLKNSLNPLHGFCRLFRSISGRNRIKALSILIRVDWDLEPTWTLGDEWGELERVLLNPGWSFLVQLDLRFIVPYVQREGLSWEALEQLPETQLQGLASSKRIAFSFSC